MADNLDIPGRLKLYFPIFFELLGDNKLNWKKVTKLFSTRLTEWTEKYEKTKKNVKAEASFFHIISSSLQGDEKARSHLAFIQNLFEELVDGLEADERKLVVPALYGMLTNIDRKFYNFLGELCVLNNIKKSGKYKLIDVEVPVVAANPKGAKLDFKLLDMVKSTYTLVEIVNVHIEGAETWNDEKVNNILHQKLQGKLNATGIAVNSSFILIPVFWGQFSELCRIHRFYTENNTSFQNTMEPTCFAPFTDKNNKHVYFFGTLDSIVSKAKCK